MNGYAALLRLQLINRFADLKPKNLRAAMKENKGRAIWRAIGILEIGTFVPNSAASHALLWPRTSA